MSGELPPGAILAGEGTIEPNAGLERRALRVINTGEVPVQLTAYFHVFEANPRLCFDRRRAFGMRPDVPIGGAVRIEPGATVELIVVPFTGRRQIYGFNGLVDGPLNDADLDVLLARLIDRGFCHQPDNPPPLPALGEGVGG